MPNDEFPEKEPTRDQVPLDDSYVPVFRSIDHDGEMEAMAIKGVLDSCHIPAVIMGPQVLPSLEFQVQVPKYLLGRAAHMIREAKLAGPAAAYEAEAASE